MKTTVSDSPGLLQKILFACGIIAPLIYVGTDIIAALQWEGYSYAARSVSELRAIGAPTRAFLVPFLSVYAVLEIAFGLGVFRTVGGKRSLRITGLFFMALGVLDLSAHFFPMHIGGTMRSDAPHLIATAITVILILLVIGFGAAADGKWFRIYSIATILIVPLFGMLAGMDAPKIDTHEPTPWLGIKERINIYSYMLWMLVLAIVLLRTVRAPSSASGKSGRL